MYWNYPWSLLMTDGHRHKSVTMIKKRVYSVLIEDKWADKGAMSYKLTEWLKLPVTDSYNTGVTTNNLVTVYYFFLFLMI